MLLRLRLNSGSWTTILSFLLDLRYLNGASRCCNRDLGKSAIEYFLVVRMEGEFNSGTYGADSYGDSLHLP
jgi:hypothetical protein